MTGDRTKVTILDMEDRDGTILGTISDLSIVTDGLGNFVLSGIQVVSGIISFSGVIIKDEGILQGLADILDFVGEGVGVTVLGDTATINIPGNPSVSGLISGMIINDEGILQGLAKTLDFVGEEIVAIVIGDVATITVTSATDILQVQIFS